MRIASRSLRWLSCLIACGAAVLIPSAAHASSAGVPFNDEYANGTLTLCNRDNQPVTAGSLLDIPFVWSAVSSTPAPQGYTRAYLAVYQPIQYVDPGDWSGYQLT